jgi:hypothetical protein
MRSVHWIGILTLAALLGAAEPATKPVVDLSTPQAALHTFAQAVRRGDTATALAVTIHDAQRAPFITAAAELCGQQHRLAEAVAARFSAAEAQRFESDDMHALLQVDAATIHLHGDTATLSRPGGDLTLRKGAEGWKLDINTLIPPQAVAQVVRDLPSMLRATAEITQQVKVGRYASAAEVQAALKTRLEAPSPPATAPSTTAPVAR